LATRVPILHFFDGFRTSHEVAKIEQLPEEDFLALLDPELIRQHRARALTPDRPVLRGTAQNPDVFFQAREACNPFHEAVPGIVQAAFDRLAERTGRKYGLFEYLGAPDAEHVVVLMGSGVGAAREAVAHLTARGAKVGLVTVRLYRPFDARALVALLPPTVRRIAALDRTKEPGALGEPLYQDIVTTLAEAWPSEPRPAVHGGRYGLSSKEFTPAMVVAVFDELARAAPRRHFTVGIVDDVTHLSLRWDKDVELALERGQAEAGVVQALFYGLGSDGTVGANKNSVKIIGEGTELYAQGYFVYDSRKSGAVTVSHLRFSPRPIESTYLIGRAGFVACHQFHFLERMDVLERAADGATFLLSSPYGPDKVWDELPREAQQTIITRRLRVHVVDAVKVATEAGLGGRINTVMQTCFFALSGVLPREEAIERIKRSIEKSYAKSGRTVLERNFAAVDLSLAALHEVQVPAAATSKSGRLAPFMAVGGATVPDFVARVTARILAGEGDLLPVSALPVDGTFPTGTAQFEKRGLAREIPIWDAALCIDCALCALVCPHAAIRIRPFGEEALVGAPEGFPSKAAKAPGAAGARLTVQVAPDDCTGCGICVDVCPARSKEVAKHKAIDMLPRAEHLERERANYDHFLRLPEVRRQDVDLDSVQGTQAITPLFEYSGACAGCGETPYLKLMTQVAGDRLIVANATGCSSIFGGNLPTTPWTKGPDGRGPAWANSLFEDNAEFGFGMRLALDQQRDTAMERLRELVDVLGEELVTALLAASTVDAEGVVDEAGIAAQRERVVLLRQRLAGVRGVAARDLMSLADALVPKSLWIVGGDGWAYDIGFGGLDHVIASDKDVNIIVLDTGVYSNTGGQASKATPRAAVAKFAAAGKPMRKKDLGLLAVQYGHVYVAQIALGANPKQALRAMREAASYQGPALILAYSHCIAHGIDMSTAMSHQRDATQVGFWPLWRYDPRLAHAGKHPFQLDSKRPTKPFSDFAAKEARFAMLSRSDPEAAKELLALAQHDIDDTFHLYEQMAGLEREVSGEVQS